MYVFGGGGGSLCRVVGGTWDVSIFPRCQENKVKKITKIADIWRYVPPTTLIRDHDGRHAVVCISRTFRYWMS